MPKCRLYIIPHAGGSAMGYMAMKRFIHVDGLEIVPLELAGRGRRIKEPCVSDINKTIDDLYSQIKDDIGKTQYAIFGHSLGALLTYELVRRIEKEQMPEPKCIFVSGRCAPFVTMSSSVLGDDRDVEARDLNLVLHAVPKELQKNQELIQLLLPILHADIKMAEDYVYEEGTRLNTDIYALYGKQDVLVDKENMERWNQITNKRFQCSSFEGDHFYYTKHRNEVGQMITDALGTK